MNTAIVCALTALSAGGPSPENAPAKVEHSAAGGTITLTEKAEQRLAITVGKVEMTTVRDVLVRSAEIMAAPGDSAPTVAPVTGTVEAPPGRKTLLVPGAKVSQGQVIMRLLPLIAPDRNLEVETNRDYELAKARLDMAQKRAARMKTLLAEGAVDVAALEGASTELSVAQAELDAAKQRAARTKRNPMSADVSLSLRAPHDGILTRSDVAVGQTVAQAAPLFDVVSFDKPWARTEVFVGSSTKIDHSAPATVQLLGSNRRVTARFVDRPPLAAGGSAVSLFYVITEEDPDLVPGTRAMIYLPLSEVAKERLVAPWSSIVYDANGTGWVYTKTAPQTYVRRRVEVSRIVGDLAVLDSGPAPGTEVATAGVIELFGTETGIGK